MSRKSSKRVPTNVARLERRTNTSSTFDSKSSFSTLKQKENVFVEPERKLKIFESVDDKNIDEILELEDPSLIPADFLSELQQDEIYATILDELQKKFSSHFAAKLNERKKLFSPTILQLDDEQNENDHLTVTEDLSSSSENDQDDFDTDIEPENLLQEIHDPSGRTSYMKMCHDKKIVPCSYFMAHIQDNEMILRYHQFSTEDFEPIAKALQNNVSIETLHLDGNFLQQQAAKHISKLLTTNDFITDLSLAENRLGGGRGTQEICRMLTINQNLKRINLSGNMFNESDVSLLVEAFEKNKVLSELDLSRNRFGENAGKIIGNFLSGNYSLEFIDLSWNNFGGKSGIELVQGIKENTFLKRCNLQMNGLGPDSGPALGECVKQNTTLIELNLDGNRLSTSNAFSIAQGFLENKSLQRFKAANNEINTDGILAILFAVKINDGNSLKEIDFSQMVVTKDAEQVIKDIKQAKQEDFVCHTGKILDEKLTPNSLSECYVKTDLDALKRLGREAGYTATEKDPPSWLKFT